MNFITIFLVINAISFIDSLEIQRDCKRFKLKNGRIRNKPRAKLHRFFCNKGYQLVGEKYGYCTNGSFDISLPICVRPTCKKIREWKSGVFFPFANGAAVQFYCRSNYQLLGNNITYCDGENWVNNLPTCIETGKKPELSCDFEYSDLCGWSDDLNHDVDWIRRNSSSVYGFKSNLRYDHTFGDHFTGNYMTLDYLARMNNTARLHSPLYSNMSSLCFTFYYHLSGSVSGTLNVYVKKLTEQFETLSPMFTVSKHHNDDWNLGRIVIDDGVSEDFQIIFEAVRGAHFLSNIAIDDVDLSESCSEDLDFISPSMDTGISEDFSSANPLLWDESCENRCNSNETLDYAYTCLCTESCIENQTCCSDYIMVCGGWFASSIDEDLAYSTEFSLTDEIMAVANGTNSSTQEETDKVIEITTKTPTTSELPFKMTTVTNSTPTSTTVPTTKKTTPKTETTTKKVTSMKTEATTKKVTSMKTETTKKTTPTTKKPTPSTTIASTKKATSTTIPTKNTKKSTTTMKTTTILMNRVLQPDKELSTNDVFAHPDDTFETMPIETDYADEDHTDKAKTFHRNEHLKTTYPNVQFLSNKEKPSPGIIHEALLEIGISTLVGVLLMLIAVLLLAKKYNFRCINLKRNNRRNNDSMSDVRFLTNDEVLDFTWRTEECNEL